MEAKRYRPWSSATAYMVWEERNCVSCTQYSDDAEKCPLMLDLAMGAISDGMISEETARGIGLIDEHGERIDQLCPWRCPAYEADEAWIAEQKAKHGTP